MEKFLCCQPQNMPCTRAHSTLVSQRLWGGKSLLAWAAAAQGSSSVRRPLRLPSQFACDATTAIREALASSVRDCIRLWCRTGSGAAKVFSLGPRLPKARRAFADPLATSASVPVAATAIREALASSVLVLDSCRRLEIAFDYGVAPALGRQKSSRVGRDGPRLVERSPTPSPPFFSLTVSPLQLPEMHSR